MRGFSPWARQVPKMDASVILLSVPCSERVPPLILRLTTKWRRLRSAALLSAGASGSATKTKSSLDVAFDASAQFGMGCRRVVEEGLADGEQLAFQGHLGCAPPLGLGMSAGFGPVVNPVDGVGPPGQWRIIGVEGAQVVDVSQQMGPAAVVWDRRSGGRRRRSR